MATTDLKVMVKQSLEKGDAFFEEAVGRMEDLRFYISRFNASYDDLMVEKIDRYIRELEQLKARITGESTDSRTTDKPLGAKLSESLKQSPKYDKKGPALAVADAKSGRFAYRGGAKENRVFSLLCKKRSRQNHLWIRAGLL